MANPGFFRREGNLKGGGHSPITLSKFSKKLQKNFKQESIPVGCVPPACLPYVLRCPLLGVSTSGGEEVGYLGPMSGGGLGWWERAYVCDAHPHPLQTSHLDTLPSSMDVLPSKKPEQNDRHL